MLCKSMLIDKAGFVLKQHMYFVTLVVTSVPLESMSPFSALTCLCWPLLCLNYMLFCAA